MSAAPSSPPPDESEGSSVRFIAAVAIGTVCVVGLLSAALRPLLSGRLRTVVVERTRQAQRSAALARGDIDAALSPEDKAHLEGLLRRLRALQEAHRQRHPTWYGEPDAATLASAAQALAAAEEEDRQQLGGGGGARRPGASTASPSAQLR